MHEGKCYFPNPYIRHLYMESYKTKRIQAKANLIRPKKAFVLRACVNTSKQIHLHYSERNSMHYAVFWLFKSHIHSCITQQRQQELHKHIALYSPGYYCLPLSLDRGDSESVASNCCSCSWCCLWLINEFVDQREKPWSHWKFRPISLLYPPKAYSPLLINATQQIWKTHHGKTNKMNEKTAATVTRLIE